ncbi:hypothetical protein D3C78_954610 [compost metagenome]
MFEGKHLPGTGKTALDFIDNQGHPGLFGDPAQPPQPVEIGRNHPALALHDFNDHRRRQLHTGLRIVQQVFQIMQVGLHPALATQTERATVVIGERHELHAIAEQRPQRLLRSQAAHQA